MIAVTQKTWKLLRSGIGTHPFVPGPHLRLQELSRRGQTWEGTRRAPAPQGNGDGTV